MAHELEIAEDGRVAFALRGAPAWHNLADHVFGEDEHVTTDQMLNAAHLAGWNVRLVDAQGYAPQDWRFNANSYFVVRDNPFDGGIDVLSVVGGRYKVLQNEELFTFGDEILHGGASWETAGSIRDGRVVFGSLVVPREFTLDPNGAADTTRTYLLVNTSHDGSVAIQASITPVRVVCQNTLNMALRGVKQSFKIRHTSTAGGKVQAARETLALTYSYMDEFEKEAKALFETSINDKQFNDLIVGLYPKPEKDAKGAVTKWENKITLVNDLYFTSPTNENVKGTAWGAFNALTERLDYYRTARKGKGENMFAAASGFDPAINVEKGKILTAVKSLVTV
jgi:phage/plasmid-like protein (TIGR03299 family)